MSEHIWGTRLDHPELDSHTIARIRRAFALTAAYQSDPDYDLAANLAREARRDANYVPPIGYYFSKRVGGIASLTVMEFDTPKGRRPMGAPIPRHIRVENPRHLRAVGNRLRFTHQLPAPEDPNTMGMDLVNIGGAPYRNLVQLDIEDSQIEALTARGLDGVEIISRLPANVFDISEYDRIYRAADLDTPEVAI